MKTDINKIYYGVDTDRNLLNEEIKNAYMQNQSLYQKEQALSSLTAKEAESRRFAAGKLAEPFKNEKRGYGKLAHSFLTGVQAGQEYVSILDQKEHKARLEESIGRLEEVSKLADDNLLEIKKRQIRLQGAQPYINSFVGGFINNQNNPNYNAKEHAQALLDQGGMAMGFQNPKVLAIDNDNPYLIVVQSERGTETIDLTQMAQDPQTRQVMMDSIPYLKTAKRAREQEELEMYRQKTKILFQEKEALEGAKNQGKVDSTEQRVKEKFRVNALNKLSQEEENNLLIYETQSKLYDMAKAGKIGSSGSLDEIFNKLKSRMGYERKTNEEIASFLQLPEFKILKQLFPGQISDTKLRFVMDSLADIKGDTPEALAEKFKIGMERAGRNLNKIEQQLNIFSNTNSSYQDLLNASRGKFEGDKLTQPNPPHTLSTPQQKYSLEELRNNSGQTTEGASSAGLKPGYIKMRNPEGKLTAVKKELAGNKVKDGYSYAD